MNITLKLADLSLIGNAISPSQVYPEGSFIRFEGIPQYLILRTILEQNNYEYTELNNHDIDTTYPFAELVLKIRQEL